MKLLIATHNPAKYRRYRTFLEQLPDVTLFSLRDVVVSERILEDGTTAAENAQKKAQGYASLTGFPSLSIDEALFIEGFAPQDQPGIHVRRYLGREATDEELLTVFLTKLRPLTPAQRCGRWTYAMCLAFPDGRTALTQVLLPTLFTDTPRLPLVPGYPLHSLQIDPRTGKHLRDCTPEEERLRLAAVSEAVNWLVREAQNRPDRVEALS